MSFLEFSPWLALTGLFGTYALTSTFFYYFPHLLHKKRIDTNKKTKFLIISHRGGAGENIENTLAAFEHSEKIGVDVFELDVHLTKDEQVVVSHDSSLKRNAGVDKLISEMNYAELPELLKNTLTQPFDYGSIDSFQDYHNTNFPVSNKIPLLEEIFEKFPTHHVNVDIKVDNDTLIEKVSYLIQKYNREHLTVWGSFNENVNKKAYKLNSNINLMFSWNGVVRLFILMVTGLLPFKPLKESYFEIIMPNIILKFFIRKSFVKHLQKRGILVYFWVLNSDEEFDLAFSHGVNGVITDYPSKLIKFLDKFPKCK